MSAVAKAGKPVMRGLLHNQIKINLSISIGLAILSGIAYRFAVYEPRKATYAEFYKNYDIESEFNRIRNKGLFDSCAKD